ncbi:sulfatase family protein [Rubritalea squalenifaciens]|nr:sulfatase [Rubritalea squalenifaciens]
MKIFPTLFSLACACSLPLAQAREVMDKPNVIIIYLDDSGYGDFSYNGNPVIETPNISRLAHNGLNCTQFYVSSPACSASRYSLLTGRYPGRSGFGTWVIGPGSKPHLRSAEITIAEGLKANGYKTGMFGKWHLGNPNKGNQMSTEALPLAHGFDTWVGTNVSHDYDNAKLLKSDPSGNKPVKGYSEVAKNLPSDDEASTSLTGLYTDAAVSFIKQNKDKPFFAYVAHNQPHLGLYVSEKFKGKSKRGLLGDVMAEVDDSVGRILQTLKDEGIDKNTLVVFSSDNGPWILFRDLKFKNHPKYGEARTHVGYAQPFRDGKGSTWEGGHRVPGIFYWPGVIKPQRLLAPVSTLDVLPTVLTITGAKLPDDRKLDGRNISPYLLGSDSQKVDDFEFIYSYFDNKPSAIRVGPWKLHIRIGSQTGNNYNFKASEKQPLLFNVEEDLGERIDRASEQPEIVERLLKKLRDKRSEIEKTGVIK